jgi:hypothetical protein
MRDFPYRDNQFDTDVVQAKVTAPKRFDASADQARSARLSESPTRDQSGARRKHLQDRG